MLYLKESRKSIDEVGTAIEEAAKKRKFGVLTVHNLKETMKKKGVEFEKECRIFEICNPQQAKKVLEADTRISTALPCRISVYEDGGTVKIATIKPTAQLAMFGRKDLASVAAEVEKTIIEIMDEAAG
ncbi:MAG: DUF302 domain-containing protein [Candidatus Abyssobacteria bacterium SURF_17]|jgi:uncharacterized protein (DUF302 family)|uniref:DUF302 domain-containing protein n=1 Tax=Candidatus Abyssobacteria bacterium SURF_17 TaxID=2093361 RepID=A0A419EXP5_9BACT|nr:MAG: DUF302 domain-containing protein [Candidatus Abyssubacteria bacterium SURF_17]